MSFTMSKNVSVKKPVKKSGVTYRYLFGLTKGSELSFWNETLSVLALGTLLTFVIIGLDLGGDALISQFTNGWLNTVFGLEASQFLYRLGLYLIILYGVLTLIVQFFLPVAEPRVIGTTSKGYRANLRTAHRVVIWSIGLSFIGQFIMMLLWK